MTDKNLTEIICLVDRSGSMDSVRDDSIGGFNAFLKEQQDSKHGKCLLTYVQFDSQSIDTVHECKPIHRVPKLTHDTFVPRGGTPLREAMCKTIDDAGRRFAALDEDKRPGNVVFVVLTDGEENASGKGFTHEMLQEKVRIQTDDFDWTFVFLAQNIDAFAAGRSIGVDMNNAKHFVGNMMKGGAGAQQVYFAASAGINNLRAKSARGQGTSYSTQDKEELTRGLTADSAVVLSSTEDSLDDSSSTTDSSAE
jgi:hypothetical protein